MKQRRWNDPEHGHFAHLRRYAIAAWPFAACLAAVSVIVAMMASLGSILATQDNVRAAAAESKKAAVESKRAAVRTEESAGHIKRLLDERAGLVAKLINDINASLAKGIELHDNNANAGHDRLESLIARRPAPAVVRVPITVAPRVAPPRPPAAPPPTVAPKPQPVGANPPTTTTTCPPRGKSGACK